MKEAIKRVFGAMALPDRLLISLPVHTMMLIFGFLLSSTAVFGGAMPFGAAFAAAQRREFSVTAGAGAILGCFVAQSRIYAVAAAGSVIIAIAVKWVLLHIYIRRNSPLLSMLSAAVGLAFSTVVLFLSGYGSAALLLRGVEELLLGSAGAFFVSAFLPLLTAPRPFSHLHSRQLCATVFTVSVLLASLAQFDIFGISPARAAAMLCVLCAACYGGVAPATICGAAFGFGMSAVSENAGYLVITYTLAGMLSGAFCGCSKIICALIFFGGALCSVLGYAPSDAVTLLCEALFAGAALLLLPKNAQRALTDIFAPSPSLTRVDSMRKNIVMRLKFASNALTDVSSTVASVAKRLGDRDLMPRLTDVFEKTENEACNGCGLRIHCFEKMRQDTHEAFLKMTRDMKRKGRLYPDDYPQAWYNRCISPDAVALSLYENFSVYEAKRVSIRRVSEIRSTVADQMDGLSAMLFDVACEFNEAEKYDTDSAAKIADMLRCMGIVSTYVSCKTDRRSRMSVEICAVKASDRVINRLALVRKMGALTGRRFDVPSVTHGSSKMLITVTEKTNFQVELGVAQYSCRNNKLCGDSYNCFNDGRGNYIMILSDGMGCGGRAAVDSAMAANMLARLIKAGFGFECSLKIVNSAMMFKSSDESLATVDITAVDLYSGQADFYKAGAPDTIVLKGKKTGRAKCSAFPAGILREVKFDKTSTVLERRNIVLMVSDGVTDIESGWIEKALYEYKNASAQQIAEHIAELSRRRRKDGREDDITVMAGVIEAEN